jgi:hypothetical protein
MAQQGRSFHFLQLNVWKTTYNKQATISADVYELKKLTSLGWLTYIKDGFIAVQIIFKGNWAAKRFIMVAEKQRTFLHIFSSWVGNIFDRPLPPSEKCFGLNVYLKYFNTCSISASTAPW